MSDSGADDWKNTFVTQGLNSSEGLVGIVLSIVSPQIVKKWLRHPRFGKTLQIILTVSVMWDISSKSYPHIGVGFPHPSSHRHFYFIPS